MPRYTLKIRHGAKVERLGFERLDAALEAVEERGRALERSPHTRPVALPTRHFEPIQQVAARLELSGPERLRAGLDIRGDGSAEGFTGRIRRRVIAQRGRESAYDALRRATRGWSGA